MVNAEEEEEEGEAKIEYPADSFNRRSLCASKSSTPPPPSPFLPSSSSSSSLLLSSWTRVTGSTFVVVNDVAVAS